MKLAFIDFETQGLDIATTNPTELGLSLWDNAGGTWQKTGGLSQLMWDKSYPSQPPEIVELTGITDEELMAKGAPPSLVFADVLNYQLRKVDYAIAHNAAYDRGVYEATAGRLGLSVVVPPGGWICTQNDVVYPKKFKCKHLSHLVFDHGLPVEHAKLHRAEYDCDILASLILEKYNIEEIVAYRDIPWVFLQALVPGPWTDGGKGVEAAKLAGYSWEKIWRGTDVFPKTWIKRVKATQVEAERDLVTFPIRTREPEKKD